MELYFETIQEECEKSDKFFLEIKNYFKKFIEPIYGSQEKFLEKIRRSRDRRCKLLFSNGSIEGIVVYKTRNSSEFEALGASNALEIKTLMLVQKRKKMSGMLVSALYNEVAKAAIQLESGCIVATVSAELNESYNITRKLGFSCIAVLKNKNLKNKDEYLICHSNPLELFRTTRSYVKRICKKT